MGQTLEIDFKDPGYNDMGWMACYFCSVQYYKVSSDRLNENIPQCFFLATLMGSQSIRRFGLGKTPPGFRFATRQEVYSLGVYRINIIELKKFINEILVSVRCASLNINLHQRYHFK